MVRNLVRLSAVFLALAVVLLSYLQGIGSESLFPLGTNARGFLDFHSAAVTPDEAQAEFRRFHTEEGLEIYTLATAGVTSHLDLYEWGVDPSQPVRDIPWLNFSTSGQVIPVAEPAEQSITAVYVLKGPSAGIERFREWAESQSVEAMWDSYNPIGFFATSLIQAGAGLLLAVTAILIMAVTVAWYATRAETRSVRVLSGSRASRIQLEDTVELCKLIIIPSAVTAAAAIGMMWLLRGPAAGILVLSASVELAAVWLLVVIFGSCVSVMTWPRVSAYAERIPATVNFRWVSQAFKFVVLLSVFICLPLLTNALDQADRADDTAAIAAALPSLFKANIGVVDVHYLMSKDAEAADVITDLEHNQNIAYSSADTTESATEFGYGGVVLYNELFFNDLKTAQPELQLVPVSQESLDPALREWIISRFDLRGLESFEQLSAYTQRDGGPVLASAPGGLMTFIASPLILVARYVSDVMDPMSLFPNTTQGKVLFTDAETLISQFSAIGVTATASRMQDKLHIYAYYQHTKLNIATMSLLAFGLAALTLVIISSTIYTILNVRKLFPRFINGDTWPALLQRSTFINLGILVVSLVISCGGLALLGASAPLLQVLLVSVIFIFVATLSQYLDLKRVFKAIRERSY